MGLYADARKDAAFVSRKPVPEGFSSASDEERALRAPPTHSRIGDCRGHPAWLACRHDRQGGKPRGRSSHPFDRRPPWPGNQVARQAPIYIEPIAGKGEAAIGPASDPARLPGKARVPSRSLVPQRDLLKQGRADDSVQQHGGYSFHAVGPASPLRSASPRSMTGVVGAMIERPAGISSLGSNQTPSFALCRTWEAVEGANPARMAEIRSCRLTTSCAADARLRVKMVRIHRVAPARRRPDSSPRTGRRRYRL